jgi:precorrin-2 dehydrogenase/sirohydrochlorin ferrochelatase
LCDFYMPAVVKRGDLKIALSTNGRSPELAKGLRAFLERRIGEEFGRAVEEAGRLRDAVRERMPANASRRMQTVRDLVRAEELIDALDRGDQSKVETIIESWKSCLSD